MFRNFKRSGPVSYVCSESASAQVRLVTSRRIIKTAWNYVHNGNVTSPVFYQFSSVLCRILWTHCSDYKSRHFLRWRCVEPADLPLDKDCVLGACVAMKTKTLNTVMLILLGRVLALLHDFTSGPAFATDTRINSSVHLLTLYGNSYRNWLCTSSMEPWIHSRNTDNATGWKSGVRFPAGVSNLCVLRSVQTGSEAYIAAYPMGAGGPIPGRKMAGAWSWNTSI